MRSVNFKGETGSAVIELIGFGLLLQIPLVMLATNLLLLQHDQLAAEAITRDVLRSFTPPRLPQRCLMPLRPRFLHLSRMMFLQLCRW